MLGLGRANATEYVVQSIIQLIFYKEIGLAWSEMLKWMGGDAIQ